MQQPDGKIINLVELGKIEMSEGHENETEHIVHDHHTLAGRRTLYMPGASAGNDHWWADVSLPALNAPLPFLALLSGLFDRLGSLG